MERIYGKSIYEGIVIAEPYLKGQKNFETESFSLSDENIERETERYETLFRVPKNKLSNLDT